MIGETGLIIERADIELSLSGHGPRPAGTPPNWKGVMVNSASLRIPGVFSGVFVLSGFGVGSGGVSGTLGAVFPIAYSGGTFTGDLVGTVFGMQGGLSEIALTLQQNIPVGGGIKAKLRLPFFENTDEPVDIEIGLSANGHFTVAIDTPDGLVTICKPGLFSVTLNSLGFDVLGDTFIARLSGDLTPLFGAPALDWPTVAVKELSIDSDGNVRLEGGWLDLPEQHVFNFYGFQLEISKLGFGKTDDDGNWIGFSGGLNLMDGVPAGASVEGLRITWYEDGREPTISFNGVGVEFEVPDVVRFKGAVSYCGRSELTLPNSEEAIQRFDGTIKLELFALDLQLEAILTVGSASGSRGEYNFFAIYVAGELPAGIPLGSSGLGLYGMSGLFALSMLPNKREQEEWYEGWYKRSPVGATDLATKWAPDPEGLAFGGGITVGTISDNGYTFSGRMLLAIVLPGPVLLIEGKANLLRERARLGSGGEPVFRALAVLDKPAGEFLIGTDARYKYGEDGELIDIRGCSEASFNLHDAHDWHLNVGEKEPRSKRVHALIFRLFDANSYFMLDAHGLEMGAWVGYDKKWKFGPLQVALEGWITGAAAVSWKPAHFSGEMWLHGRAELRAFNISAGLSAEARIMAEAFEPFHLKGDLRVKLKTPWPLPDPSAHVMLQWGPQLTLPPLSLPVQEIAVEHPLVTTSWPLPRGKLLLPDYDLRRDGFFRAGENPSPSVDVQEKAAPPADVPVVPLDCRPRITFARPINDDAMLGVNVQPGAGEWEQIGDPARGRGPVRVRYGLQGVALHKWEAETGEWILTARKGSTGTETEGTEHSVLYGSWAPVPAMDEKHAVAQTKLWLWSKNPFDYVRHTSGGWSEWFNRSYPEYPCVPPAPSRQMCIDFEDMAIGSSISPLLPSSFTSTPLYWNRAGITLRWWRPWEQVVDLLPCPVNSFSRGVFFDGSASRLAITLQEPCEAVRLTIVEPEVRERRFCDDFGSYLSAEIAGRNPRELAARYTVHDSDGAPAPHTRIRKIGAGMAGLECGFGVTIELPYPCFEIELTFVHEIAGTRVECFDESGASVGDAVAVSPKPSPFHAVYRLSAPRITRIVISECLPGPFYIHRVCFTSGAGAQATGFDSKGRAYGPVAIHDNMIQVAGRDLVAVAVRSANRFCIAQVCATLPPDPVEVARRDEMRAQLHEGTARWKHEGHVLEPHTSYRIKVVTTVQTKDKPIGDFSLTEFGYFRTEGPPGLANLSVPLFPPSFDATALRDDHGVLISTKGTPTDHPVLKSSLNDLSPYVRQTVPPTLAKPRKKPQLARFVYRAYDVGVEFVGGTEYIDQMYRQNRRDLGLYLYDNNNRLLRNQYGAPVVLGNRWGRMEDLQLAEVDERWVATVNGSGCAEIDRESLVRQRTLVSAGEEQVLDPDTAYDARLIPLILHEDFSTRLGPRWTPHDETPDGGPSEWTTGSTGSPVGHFAEQRANIGGATSEGTVLLLADDALLPPNDPDQPGRWTDFLLSIYLRVPASGALGVVFRYRGPTDFYRLSLSREHKRRMLVKVSEGQVSILADEKAAYAAQTDYLLTVEAARDTIRVYQDGRPILAATDATHRAGRIGLYCWRAPTSRFTSLRVDDLRECVRPVYRFGFVTSRFTNFFHHVHSFQERAERVELTAGFEITEFDSFGAPPSRSEVDAFERVATAVLGGAPRDYRPQLQVTRLEREGVALGFLVRTGEPIDWERTSVEILRTDVLEFSPLPPRTVKMTDVTLSSDGFGHEAVTLLLREPVNLTGYTIEYLPLPDGNQENNIWLPYYRFGAEDLAAAGLKVCICSGATNPTLFEEARVVKRLITSHGQSVGPSLPIGGAILRVREPNGDFAHQRAFRPNGAYSPLEAQVLRNSDGTAFAIVRPGGAEVPRGDYRFRFVYLRKSRFASFTTFSEAGCTDPERADVDVSWTSA
jgi:hypothetical protein